MDYLPWKNRQDDLGTILERGDAAQAPKQEAEGDSSEEDGDAAAGSHVILERHKGETAEEKKLRKVPPQALISCRSFISSLDATVDSHAFAEWSSTPASSTSAARGQCWATGIRSSNLPHNRRRLSRKRGRSRASTKRPIK